MAIYDDLDDHRSNSDFIERCHRDFVNTENPLFAWEAWGMVRFTWRSELHESLELPEWLGEYLDVCGERLIGIPMEVVERKPLVRIAQGGVRLKIDKVLERPVVPAKAGEGPGSFGRALKFSKGLALARSQWGGPFDTLEKRAARVIDLMWSHGCSLAHAAEWLEKKGISRSSAKRAVNEADGYSLRTMKNRLLQATGAIPDRREVVRAYSRLCKSRAR